MSEGQRTRLKRVKTKPKASAASRSGVAGLEPNIGGRLRHARLVQNLNLKEVATLSGCSESFISKLENNKVKPSFTMLHRIAAVLGVSITHILETGETEAAAQVVIFTAAERRRARADGSAKGNGGSTSLEFLTPRGNHQLLQASIHHIAPGGKTDGILQHDGETLGYVLAGQIELILNGTTSTLQTGDSFLFPSTLPHGYRNRGQTAAKVLWVNTPPDF